MLAFRRLIRREVPHALAGLLVDRPQAGYDLVIKVKAACPAAGQLGEAALYGVLHLLESRRLVESRWQPTAAGTQQKVYMLTDRGLRRAGRVAAGPTEAPRKGTITSATAPGQGAA